MNILIFGDIIGRPGRRIIKDNIKKIKEENKIDFIIANAENSAGGFGITKTVYEELKSFGIDVLTSGNHIWDKKEVFEFIDKVDDLIRPLNMPKKAPGKGFSIKNINGKNICVLNLMGRVFMDYNLDNPFNVFDEFYKSFKDKFDLLVVDFHGEASSEKYAFGYYADSRATFVFGTHTHVPTCDERVLPNGTGFISDIGMTGAYHSIIGTDLKAIEKYISGIPMRFEIPNTKAILNAIVIEINDTNNKIENIKRVKILESEV